MTNATFQSTVNIFNALGLPGELAFAGAPKRAEEFILFSSGTPNQVGYAFTVTAGGNPNPSLNSPLAQTAQVGGTGVFAGILVSPKEYPLYGSSVSALTPSDTVPDYANASLLKMGYIFVNLPGPANPGDLVTYDPLTGALNSIAPVTSFTGSIAPGGSAGVLDVLTVTAVSAGQLAVGQLISGAGVAGGTFIASFGTGLGFTGTYNLSSVNEQTVGSEVMTAPGMPAPAFAASSAHIIGTTLTITTLTSGQLNVGQQVFGTGVLPNTVIVGRGTGVGGTGTYTVNNSQTTTNPIAMTGPLNVFVPRATVAEYATNSAGGVSCIYLNN